LRRDIYALADRLHKTPAEIRRDFTYEDYTYFLAHLQLEREKG
jgi:hypothetical protein